jgi:hypothetical protein
MTAIYINDSAFMVLPDFLHPTSGTFSLMAASHIRPSFELFIRELDKVTGILMNFTGSVTGTYFDDFPILL